MFGDEAGLLEVEEGGAQGVEQFVGGVLAGVIVLLGDGAEGGSDCFEEGVEAGLVHVFGGDVVQVVSQGFELFEDDVVVALEQVFLFERQQVFDALDPAAGDVDHAARLLFRLVGQQPVDGAFDERDFAEVDRVDDGLEEGEEELAREHAFVRGLGRDVQREQLQQVVDFFVEVCGDLPVAFDGAEDFLVGGGPAEGETGAPGEVLLDDSAHLVLLLGFGRGGLELEEALVEVVLRRVGFEVEREVAEDPEELGEVCADVEAELGVLPRDGVDHGSQGCELFDFALFDRADAGSAGSTCCRRARCS